MDFDRNEGLSDELAKYLIDLNMELRRLHDAGPRIVGKGFDQEYEPLGGYKQSIESFLDVR